MKKLTYQILNYLLLALSIGGLIGMIVITKVAGEVNVYATLCLCLMILGIVCVVLLQCIYRVTKKPLETLDQTKECPKCHAINDKDAEFCKKCGEKFTK